MSGLRQDVAYAFRQLRRQPGFALVVVLTLGGAMGVNTSLFSIFNTVWFRPWSVADPGSMVVVRPAVSPAEWQHWAAHSKSFRRLAATRSAVYARLGRRRARFDFVTAGYFDVLGVPMARGRAFSRQDDDGRAVILSHHTWETELAGDPEIIGRTISLEGVSFTVVGVAAAGFEGPDSQRKQLWLPLAAEARLQKAGGRQDDVRNVAAAGRLVPGVSAAQAQAELGALSAAFRSEHRQAIAPIRVRSTDRYSVSPPTAQTHVAWQSILVGVTFITLVACANLANLMLARGHARRREIAVRLSMGATRPRLVRQLLVEALLLAVAAGALGVVISTLLPVRLFGTVPEMVEMWKLEFRPDHRVLAWALGVSTLACAAFGLPPALQCARISVSDALKDANGLSAPSLKTALLSWQAIVSVMSLVVAGLVLRSQSQAQVGELARSFEGVVLVRLELPRGYSAARQALVASGLEDELRTLGGRKNVAAASGDPRPVAAGDSRALRVTPDYFAVLRIPMARGRTFEEHDSPDQVMIVNEAYARRYWPGQDAIGKTLAGADGKEAAREVLGVVRDGALDLVSYQPAAAHERRVFLVREAGPAFMQQLVPVVARLDPAVRAEVVSGSAWIAQATRPAAFAATLAGGFGAFSLMLATLGFFSLAQYAVRQRTREIGIRAALGARREHILRAVLEPTVRAMVRGLLIGGAGGLCVGLFMRRAELPAGVDPLDIVTYAGVALILGVAGLAAAYIPGRHAMRISPTEALRYE